MRLMIVEDDNIILQELNNLLTSYGYECITLGEHYEDATNIILHKNPDLILLDINLPGVQGFHICREVRKQSDVPIIMVTSCDTQMDELMGMQVGADDFVTKPFHKQILLARIEALLKRTYKSSKSTVIEHDGIKIYFEQGKVQYKECEAELTRNEMRILNLMIKNVGCIVSRDEMMEELWQSDEFVDDNTLTVNVNRLRHKLDEIGKENFIVTKRGQGYMIR